MSLNMYLPFLCLLLLHLSHCTSHKALPTKQPLNEQKLWTSINSPTLEGCSTTELAANSFHLWLLNPDKLKEILKGVTDSSTKHQLWLPYPNGQLYRFDFTPSQVMAPALAAKYPSLLTYVGQALDHPVTSTRFQYTEDGFNATIIGPEGSIYIVPCNLSGSFIYISYYKSGILPGIRHSIEKQAPIEEKKDR